MDVSTRDELEHHVEAEQRVTPLELFFDLVFVFGLTQVTSLMSADPTWSGLARGMLVLAALWWAWAAYAWLTNTIDPDEGAARLAVFGAMAAMLIVGLAAPGAFDDDALLFGGAYSRFGCCTSSCTPSRPTTRTYVARSCGSLRPRSSPPD